MDAKKKKERKKNIMSAIVQDSVRPLTTGTFVALTESAGATNKNSLSMNNNNNDNNNYNNSNNNNSPRPGNTGLMSSGG